MIVIPNPLRWVEWWIRGREYRKRERDAMRRIDEEPPDEGGAAVPARLGPRPSLSGGNANPIPNSEGE